MKISREANIALNFVINELVPPFIRDSKLFIYFPFKILFKKKAKIFRDFHENVYKMSDQEFQDVNRDIQDVIIQRPTDINKKCIEEIKSSIIGDTVCDVGCGRGYLSNILAEKYEVTGIDVALEKNIKSENDSSISFIESPAENIDFPDKSFDTVICAHTLEHVRDLQKSLSELRRITKKRLIIVLPCERPYLYTFNLHIHFFPYEYSIYSLLGNQGSKLEKIDGDWFYIEDI